MRFRLSSFSLSFQLQAVTSAAMNEGIGLLGDAATGGLVARSVEPGHGEGGHDASGARCLNCGAALDGPYCHSCGQKAHLHRSVADFWHDFLHGVLHFDGKFWRTLPMLVWHPGDLTRRYIHGERARFVSPLALFLFAVFLTFAAFHNLGGDEFYEGVKAGAEDSEAKLPDGSGITANISKEHTQQVADMARLEKEIERAAEAGQPTESLTRKLNDAADSVTAIELLRPDLARAREKNNPGGSLVKAPTVHSDVPQIQHALEKFKKNPELLFYKVQSYAYKYAWALIPISAAWMWLLFPFSRRYHFYDHIVFVTYSIAFMMLFVIMIMVAMALGVSPGFLMPAFFILATAHIYRQLRGAYRGSRLGAILRTMAVLFGCVIVLTLFMAILLALGGS